VQDATLSSSKAVRTEPENGTKASLETGCFIHTIDNRFEPTTKEFIGYIARFFTGLKEWGAINL
jgi:hypothetical protein